MPMREFTDSDGVHWKVWSTVPYTTGVMRGMQSGWLTFEAAGNRRRLAPIPVSWERATLAELCAYCGQAQPVRGTPGSGTSRVDEAGSR
jgi:hypothetical protein